VQHRFTPTTFFIMGALLTWMAHFTVIYVFAAVACARGFADLTVLTLPVVPAFTIAASLLAVAITVALVHRGYSHLRRTALDEHTRFIGFVAFATGAIALVGLVWLLLPALVVTACTTT
jgi:hypothetical protein